MAANAFLDETRTERLDIGLPFLRQLRLSPTLENLLAEEKPANQSWGDYFLTAAVNQALSARNVRGDWRGSNRLIVRLVGSLSGDPDNRRNGGGER